MANEQPDPVVEEDYSDSDSDSDSSSSEEENENENDEESKQKRIENLPLLTRIRDEEPSESDNSPEANVRRFAAVLESRRMKRQQKEDDSRYVFYEDLFDFPKDREKWTEQDLQELWADAPLAMTKPGWDPVWADEDDWDVVRDEISAGRDPPIAPFYLPYRKSYPALPDNHYDISTPKSVVEELDRIEEFLKWVSYIFPDGSSYEGTVWDDLAHGKGVYVAEEGLVRYEGEWLQNNMEGHGVVEVDVPDMEPIPGSKLEAKMRAEGRIISRDFMTPEDRQWLEMDIEDSIRLADGRYEIPFYESNEWIKYFGSKPEKGRYRYAGQWKHGRMHGCGVYDVNEEPLYGRFYFGEFVEDDPRCDIGISTMHAGIAEVAAAKARMFVNKPDGMIREQRGPFNDPIHPYFYEEEDVWMAPGFINQFYEVPDYWKTYTEEVDQERQMWLNSFYKAPLRLPMPAELEYWWSKDQTPEFVLINKEPEPDPKDPSKLIYTEDPLILHTKSGRIINYIEDEEHGLRLFWQPPLEEGEDVDPEKAQFLPLGFDEFYGREVEAKKETMSDRLLKAVENVIKPVSEKVVKWAEEKKKNSELKMKLIEHELDLVEAEICLEEEIEEMTAELKKKEKEEQKKAELDFQKDKDNVTYTQDEKASFEDVEEEEEDVEEDDGEITPSSFGSIDTKDDQKGNKPGKSPFSSTSLSVPSYSLVSMVPSRIQQSFLSWKKQRSPARATSPNDDISSNLNLIGSISYPMQLPEQGCLRAAREGLEARYSNRKASQLHSLSRALCVKSQTTDKEHQRSRSRDWDNILSLNIPIVCNESFMTIK